MLHLDGIIQSTRVIQSHYWEGRDSYIPNDIKENELRPKNFFNSEILSRIASPIQIAAVGVDTVITETLRGAIRITGGILTLDWRNVRDGAVDLLSVAVQLVVLPVLALISLLSPKGAIALGRAITSALDARDADNSTEIRRSNPSQAEQVVLGTLFAIASIGLSPCRSALKVPVYLLSGEFLDTFCAIFCAVAEPFASIRRVFSSNYEFKCQQYDPMAFDNISNRALEFIFGQDYKTAKV